jgi:membrane-bound lytic murein transglycosylase B
MEFFLNFRQLKWNVSVALASGLLMVSSFAIQPAQADAAKRDLKFDAFLEEVRLEAASNGIAPEFIAALDGLHPDPEIQRLASRQPEYVKPIWSYLTHLITQKRLEIGRTKLAGEADILAQLEQEYGVPRGILVAIWGVETNYGSNKGYFPVLQALATLGYEGKRAKFGRQQLLAALEILQSGNVQLQDFKGSWAGAMGHTQFIPTTYLGYSADGTGDGVRNIWTEPHDALASAANYLKISGWKRGLPWGFEVSVPGDFDFNQADLKRLEPAAFWRQRGVLGKGREISDALGDMAVFAPAGLRGPVFLVTVNFKALLRYNTAPAYALAVGHLSQRFRDDAKFIRPWPNRDRPLLPEEISRMQSRLNAAGYDAGEADGVLGRKTITAVRKFQQASALVSDGYATPGILTQLGVR